MAALCQQQEQGSLCTQQEQRSLCTMVLESLMTSDESLPMEDGGSFMHFDQVLPLSTDCAGHSGVSRSRDPYVNSRSTDPYVPAPGIWA